ncbi:unnamed protein product [Dicrocoelium dendriticum]|nr:unnamed protein product [Dicrocoelium dendriticum]
MTAIAPNTYQNLFTGQSDVFQKCDENVVLRLAMSNADDNTGLTFVQQVCPAVVINQENAISSSDGLTELKPSESIIERGERRFACMYCAKLYHSESNLQVHQDVVHRGLRRFQCGFCGKSYAKSFLLKSHIKSVHENIRDVTCTICQKAFSKRSVMRRHMKSVHAEKKDFHCTLCQKQFTEKKNLQMHINALHKGLRPHQCDNCLKEFARKCDLLRHSNSVHRESKPYMCPICNKGFPQKWYFERHVASVHKTMLTSRPQSQPQDSQQQHTQQMQHIQSQQQQQQQQQPQQHLQPQTHHSVIAPHQHFTFFQPQAQNQTMNLPMGTIIAAPGTATTAMPAGTQVMMVAPGVNMPMSTFFFQPQQNNPFANQPNAMVHPSAVLPAVPTTLMPPSSVANSTQLIHSSFGLAPLSVNHLSTNPTQPNPSGSRPTKEYPCATCSKVYPRRQSLQAHIIQVHTDKKPYECHLCRKGFVRRWDFYRHVNSVHQDNATSAIDPDKTEEYLAWMRGRRSSLDISWECLNAVRPDLMRVKPEEPSQSISSLIHQSPQIQQQSAPLLPPQQQQPTHSSESDPLDQFSTQSDLTTIVTSDLNSL